MEIEVTYRNGDFERSYLPGLTLDDVMLRYARCPWRSGEYALVVADADRPRAACAPQAAKTLAEYRAWLDASVESISVEGLPYYRPRSSRCAIGTSMGICPHACMPKPEKRRPSLEGVPNERRCDQ